MDPLQPKPCHLYRRIYLTPSLSMFIKIDPLNPMDLPEIKFMGSETEVESKRELISKNLQACIYYYFISNSALQHNNCKYYNTFVELEFTI